MPPPNLKLLNRLLEKNLLHDILDDFYDEVYEDRILNPYFAALPKEKIKERQFSFLSMILQTGDNYMGPIMRNAHHWMVISEEIFEHRENILVKHMKNHGLED